MATTFLMVLWVGRKLDSRYVAHGVWVGVVSVILTLGFIFTARPEDRLMYGVAFVMRIAAGYLGGFAALLGLVMQIAPAQPPQILQIYREPLKPGSEAAYHAVEEDTARVAAALGCPHPYLGAESVTGSKEVWWFNGYESSAEQKQVYDDYAKNTRLMAALQQNSKRKAILTLEPVEVIAHYRPDLTVGNLWLLGRGRFLVITMTKSDHRVAGTVYEGPDGTRFIVTSVQTREQADAAKAVAGPESVILAVRPSWSFPAKGWIAADSVFWQLAHR